MRHPVSRWVILGLLLFVAVPACWSGEFDYPSYNQSTLQEIMQKEKSHSHDEAQAAKYDDIIQLECRFAKYRVPCGFSDDRRLISEKKKMVIKLWMEMNRIDAKLAALYQQEIQVFDGVGIYWIPIQEQLIPHIDRELVQNDSMELFIILTGTVESEYVFIATEYEKPLSPAGNSRQATASARTTF